MNFLISRKGSLLYPLENRFNKGDKEAFHSFRKFRKNLGRNSTANEVLKK